MKTKQVERYQPFFEMAQVGNIDNLQIEVYTDHNPPHFHVTKKDKFEVRISIDSEEPISYKWQKNGASISSSELKKVKNWLNQKHEDKNITNRDTVEMFWKAMNRKSK